MSRRSEGFTLVEMMVSVALVSIILVAAVTLVLAASRFTIRAMESAGVQASVTKIFKILDDDIQGASGFPADAAGYNAGEDTLILQNSNGGTAVYIAVEGSLERLNLETEPVRRVVLAKGLQNFKFSRRGRAVCYAFSTYLRVSGHPMDWEGCSRAGF